MTSAIDCQSSRDIEGDSYFSEIRSHCQRSYILERVAAKRWSEESNTSRHHKVKPIWFVAIIKNNVIRAFHNELERVLRTVRIDAMENRTRFHCLAADVSNDMTMQ